jgi:predicted DCC family thiol-disulfide oxidoreductase YuxK
MHYLVIYDGNCNLCVTLVQSLEAFDQGHLFAYVPMQDEITLRTFGVTEQDCTLGMMLINLESPQQHWQGSDAAEEIGRLLPGAAPLVAAYRAMPGLKWAGDRIYAYIRDYRYQLFGRRAMTYQSCHSGCELLPTSSSQNLKTHEQVSGAVPTSGKT